MRSFLAILIVLGLSSTVSAQVSVRGYYRSNGTYVQPHYRSYPDGNFYNNWSTYPNINPYTGRQGTRVTPSYDYGSSYSAPSYLSLLYSTRRPSYSTPGDPWESYNRNLQELYEPLRIPGTNRYSSGLRGW